MALNTWIFIVVCFSPFVKTSLPNRAECNAAAQQYGELTSGLRQKQRTFRTILSEIVGQNTVEDSSSNDPPRNTSVDPVKVQRAVTDLCTYFNVSARAVDTMISQCDEHSRHCGRKSSLTGFTPDVLRAIAKLCGNIQAAEHMPQIRVLATCFMSLLRLSTEADASQDTEVDSMETDRVIRLMTTEWESSHDNSTFSCGFTCRRKCACRGVQLGWPLYSGERDTKVREVCGQKVKDFFLQLQEMVLIELNCSEFGDYVQELGWLKINFQANKTRPAHQL